MLGLGHTNDVTRAPLAFNRIPPPIPVGTDRFQGTGANSYWYEQNGLGWGNEESPVRFVDLWQGGSPPFSPGAVIADRCGCDHNPIDATNADGALTLLSYVWPEPADRFIRLRNAIEMAKNTPVTIDQADAAIWLRSQLGTLEAGSVLVVLHSVVWQYLGETTQAAVRSALMKAGAATSPESPLAWLRLEPNPTTYTPAELRLTLWNGSEPHERLLATTGFDGGTLDWQN